MQSILHGESGDTFPTFSNLRTLLFDGCDLSDDFQMLGCFLNNTPSLEKLTLQYCKVLSFLLIYHVWYPCFTIFLTTCTNTVYCHKLPEGSKKSPKRMSIKCHDALTFQCPNLKLTEIKYKEDDVHQLFGLLSGIWRNLRKTTIILTKASSIKSQYPFAMLLTSSSFEIWHDLCHLPLSYQARCLGFGVSLDVGWHSAYLLSTFTFYRWNSYGPMTWFVVATDD